MNIKIELPSSVPSPIIPTQVKCNPTEISILFCFTGCGVGEEWVVLSSVGRDEGCGDKAGACTTVAKEESGYHLKIEATKLLRFL